MEVGTMVLHSDVGEVTWRRYLLPEDEAIPQDLVVAAYTLSEIAQGENRRRIIRQLWKMTRGVLILVEFANLNNFNLLMEARDTILEEKGVGLWDWQPTIVAPCPHEHRCPLRHSKVGVKRKVMRICSTDAHYRSTFIESWARALPLKVGIEPISYLIFARNEFVPERAERRAAEAQRNAEAEVHKRDEKQRELYEAALSVKDVVFERLSDEAMHRPQTGIPPKLPPLPTASDKSVELSNALAEGATSTAEIGHIPTDKPRLVQTSERRFNKLIFPLQYPPATHRFNRGFVDAGYQRQRAIKPSEMLVVREELEDMRRRVMKVSPKYLRVVRDPTCRGKIQAVFCTPEGDLISGRVYRRFYGDRNRVSLHSTMRWQHIGGWKLLKRIRSGSLFPHDVPMYAINKYPQVDFPNTLVDSKYSTVEKTAMQYNDATTAMDPSEREEDLSREERKSRERLLRDKELENKVQQQLEELFGSSMTNKDLSGHVDARREISAEMWAEAVRKARIKTIRQTKETIPLAAKIRTVKRRLEVKRRNPKIEMRLNRQRAM
ncbi:unnamed protein product [Phytomonas sp. Hart1]|nr:unnamed protein product [Phytomonas sp. Hart1]|eukprot:CCW66081.1 unnamed protein product [Phytomonas sp. isolate Hart1]